MKKWFGYLTVIVVALLMSGCARSCESFNRDFQTGDRNYHIRQYSGGTLIQEWKFKGILNNQDNSDGYYFSVNDTLYEIGGDIIISSTD